MRCNVWNMKLGTLKSNVKMLRNSNSVPRMDKWEIPKLETICYIKPNILAVAYLVIWLD